MTNKVKFNKRFVLFRALSFLFGAGLILSLWACDLKKNGYHTHMEGAAEVASIRVSPENVSIPVGHTLQLSAILGDSAGNILPVRMAEPGLEVGSEKRPTAVMGDSRGRTGRIVTWNTSQPAFVEIDSKGRVNARAIGEATITATSEGHKATTKIIVSKPLTTAPVTVIPSNAGLFVGQTLQLNVILHGSQGKIPAPIVWRSSHPSRAIVTANGLVKAIAAGTTIITANLGSRTNNAIVDIKPAKIIEGLDFPGNAGVQATMRFEFLSPMAPYPATYIWRIYPRQQQSYYTAFFWGNIGEFYPSNTYYGFHPYPDWETEYQHFWEIAAPPGGDFVSQTHVVYDRWYIQAAVCRKSEESTIIDFYWDWPNTDKVISHTGKIFDNPPKPGLVVGDAPWNQGNEVWDGVLRGFQFYDSAMKKNEIEKEIASPGAVRKPWYLNLNPTPIDISDKSGSGHHPTWAGTERPSLWKGEVIEGVIVRNALICK